MINLIPVPYEYKELTGEFVITDNIKVKSDFQLPLLDLPKGDDAELVIEKDDGIDKEGYTLDVTADSIKIKASTPTGAYYALQSLRQISMYELGGKKIPCVHISDKPRFSWRGIHLDESRHFFGKEFVKKYLDMMFMMKLNVFHWHLTDDQGWRIEIKKYPRLTEIGSVRKYSQINGWHCLDMVKEDYAFFYTQEDIKEIVQYAGERGITVVPEIDFPAHSAAALAAYPWLACRELEREVPGYFGGDIPEKAFGIKDWNRIICAGNDRTVSFVFDILDEICELFPAPYFHIGGDEAPKEEWKQCPKCQQRIKDNNLKDEEDLQGWLNNKILLHLKSKGKRLIGWNEILKAGNLDKSVIAQYWTPERDKNAEEYAKAGGNLILSNHRSFYFDMPYAKYPLKNTYSYKPEKFNFTEENMANVMGVEGEVWTEWMDSKERIEMMIYPRVQALSETAWSIDENKDWSDFKSRLNSFKNYFKLFGINWAADAVSMPKNLFRRVKIIRKFENGDTHLETKINKKYIAKGEK